jgi:hypothetical protein
MLASALGLQVENPSSEFGDLFVQQSKVVKMCLFWYFARMMGFYGCIGFPV